MCDKKHNLQVYARERSALQSSPSNQNSEPEGPPRIRDSTPAPPASEGGSQAAQPARLPGQVPLHHTAQGAVETRELAWLKPTYVSLSLPTALTEDIPLV